MSNKLTKKQKEELQKLTEELMNLSTEVIEDYELNPSEISGSLVQINEDSPFLDVNTSGIVFDGNKWKKVIKNIPENSKGIKKDNDTE